MQRTYPRHQLGNVEVGEPSDQDKRIGKLKDELRSLMGDDEFKAFYVTTSMNGDVLETQLVARLEKLNDTMTDISDARMCRKYGEAL